MADDLHYVPGTFYRIDDRSGFKVRSYHTKKEWNGLIVREQSWEPRQPQDLVRGVPDDQTVPEARPRSPNVFMFVETSLAAGAAIRATSITVESSQGFSINDQIGVMLDSGIPFRVAVTAIAGSVIGLAAPLPVSAASGNIVTDYTASQALAQTQAGYLRTVPEQNS